MMTLKNLNEIPNHKLKNLIGFGNGNDPVYPGGNPVPAWHNNGTIVITATPPGGGSETVNSNYDYFGGGFDGTDPGNYSYNSYYYNSQLQVQIDNTRVVYKKLYDASWGDPAMDLCKRVGLGVEEDTASERLIEVAVGVGITASTMSFSLDKAKAFIGDAQFTRDFGYVAKTGKLFGAIGGVISGVEAVVGLFDDEVTRNDVINTIGFVLTGAAFLTPVGWVAATLGGLSIICTVVAQEPQDRES